MSKCIFLKRKRTWCPVFPDRPKNWSTCSSKRNWRALMLCPQVKCTTRHTQPCRFWVMIFSVSRLLFPSETRQLTHDGHRKVSTQISTWLTSQSKATSLAILICLAFWCLITYCSRRYRWIWRLDLRARMILNPHSNAENSELTKARQIYRKISSHLHGFRW